MAFEARAVATKPQLAIGFLAFFGLILCLALRAGWQMTFHPIFQVLAKLLNVGIPLGFKTLHPFGFLADKIGDLDNYMAAFWGKGIAVTGHAFIEMAMWVAYQLTMIGVAIAAIGYELGKAAWHTIERTSVTYLKPVVKHITTVERVTVAKSKVVADSRVPALERELHALEAKVAHEARAVALPAPVTIPRELPKIGELDRAWQWTKDHLGTLRKLGTVAGLIGLTAAVLSKLGLGWVRCSKVGRVGRNVCGMDEALLESLIADALLVVGAVSIVEFAKALQGIEAEVVAGLERFVVEI